MQANNRFLTIEGIEGVGKSTALKYIESYLTSHHKTFIVTREPGGTPMAEQIRQLLLSPHTTERVMPETELLLMFASRIQHIHQVILPALETGQWVISDRFIDASFAYQGGGRQMDVAQIEMLETWLLKNIKPAVTLLLDAPPELGLSRAKHRGEQDRIEQETVDFFERVRAAYLARAEQDPKRFKIIDATQPLHLVQAEIKKVLDAYVF